MITFDSIIEKEHCYEFVKGAHKVVLPKSAAILVDDNSGLIAVKAPMTRKTLFAVKKAEETANEQG